METNKSEQATPVAQGSFGLKAVAVIGTTALLAGVLAFLVLPVVQGREEGLDIFASLCRAIGLQVDESAQNESVTAGSTVAFNRDTLRILAAGSAVKGGEFAADVCAACHLPNGETSDPKTVPSISGQSARAIYKQLSDIKAGIRTSDIMKPIVEGLSDAQMSDLAAYYNSLPRRNHNNPESIAVSDNTLALVLRGDSARALPACTACHEPRAGGPLEAPILTGQNPPYLEAQLKAYAAGTRRNDLYGRMRSIAAKLTPDEIAELSAYYNAPPHPRLP